MICRLFINPLRNGNMRMYHVRRTRIEIEISWTRVWHLHTGVVWLDVALLGDVACARSLLVLHSVHVPPQAIRFVFGFPACFSPTRATCHRTNISAKPNPRYWIEFLDIELFLKYRCIRADYCRIVLRGLSVFQGFKEMFGIEQEKRKRGKARLRYLL